MISSTQHIAAQEEEIEQMHTEHIESRINQFVTIGLGNAVFSMLCIGLSIGLILQVALTDSRLGAGLFAAGGVLVLLIGLTILKKSRKLSSGKEIHISSDKG